MVISDGCKVAYGCTVGTNLVGNNVMLSKHEKTPRLLSSTGRVDDGVSFRLMRSGVKWSENC